MEAGIEHTTSVDYKRDNSGAAGTLHFYNLRLLDWNSKLCHFQILYFSKTW